MFEQATRSRIERGDEDLAARGEPLRAAIQWAFWISLGMVSLLYLRTEVARIAPSWQLEQVAGLVVAFMMIFVGGLWAQSGFHEFRILCYWLRPGFWQPPTDVGKVAGVFGIALLISCLVYLAKWPHYFGLLLTIYFAVDVGWHLLIVRHLRELFSISKEEWSNASGIGPRRKEIALEALAVFERYYYNRPFGLRALVLGFMSAIGTAFAWHGYPIGSQAWIVCAYGLFAAGLIAAEISIGIWRAHRDDELRDLSQKYRAAGEPRARKSRHSSKEQESEARKLSTYTWDVFVSYSSRDQADFVEALVSALKRHGLKVWFGEESLRLGDSIRSAIDAGLNDSRFGVAVLSNSYFATRWALSELEGLLHREKEQKVVLPVWHGLSLEEARQYSPMLAGRYGIFSSMGVEAVAQHILEVVEADRRQ